MADWILDIRLEKDSSESPIQGAFNIPFGELGDRLYELPMKSECLYILATNQNEFIGCLDLLGRHGWTKIHRFDPASIRDPPKFQVKRLWRPSGVIEAHLETLRIALSTLRVPALGRPICIDVGCGSGRDLAFLADELAELVDEFVAFDQHDDLLERCERIFFRYNTISRFRRLHGRILGDGTMRLCCSNSVTHAQLPHRKEQEFIVHSADWGKIPISPWDTIVGSDHLVLLCINRYLPPRCMFPALAKSICPGGLVVVSTFVDDEVQGTWDFRTNGSTTARFSHPKGWEHILRRNELSDIHFKVNFITLVDEVNYLPDGRPILWFVAQKSI
jgi:SAM-dependent methyltransferase